MEIRQGTIALAKNPKRKNDHKDGIWKVLFLTPVYPIFRQESSIKFVSSGYLVRKLRTLMKVRNACIFQSMSIKSNCKFTLLYYSKLLSKFPD